MKWLFCSGTGRSGTTLLAWILSRHPDIYMSMHEANLPTQMQDLFLPDTGPITWTGERGTHYQSAHMVRYSPDMRERLGALELAQACLRGLHEHVAKMGYQYFGDKSPAYSVDWPTVRELCPGAKFVFIHRDVEATLQSFLKMPWGFTDLEQTRQEIERRQTSAYACPDAYHLNLEDLEAQPEHTLDLLLTHLGLRLDRFGGLLPEILYQITSEGRRLS